MLLAGVGAQRTCRERLNTQETGWKVGPTTESRRRQDGNRMGLINRVLNLLWTPREVRSAADPRTFGEIFGAATSTAGEAITADTALTTSAFYAGVNIIASSAANLPFKVFAATESGREVLRAHPVHRLLHTRPNPETGAFNFLWWLYACALMWGTGVAEIQRSGRGDPVALWGIHPTRMKPKRSGGKLIWEVSGDPGQTPVTLADANVLRIFVFSKDGVCGYGLLEAMAETLGIQLASDKYLASYLANSATPNGLFEAAEGVTPEQMTQLRQSWGRIHAGQKKAGRLGVLPPGVKYHQVGVDPRASQLIESRKATIGDYARFLNLPLSRLRNLDRATWGNYEQETNSFHTETLAPWISVLEQEATAKLISPREQESGVYVRAVVNAIMRADVAARTNYYTAMLDRGVYSINEVRELEELNGIGAAGDKHRAQMQWVDIGDRTEEQDAREHLGFLREIVKGLIADGTISDVMFNRMAIDELLSQVNVPVDPAAPEVPWLPVIADNGELVSGDVILDDAGDVVGGATIASGHSGESGGDEENDDGREPRMDANAREDRKKVIGVNSRALAVRDRGRQVREAASQVLAPLVRDACGRVVTRTFDRLRRAAKRGDDLAAVLRECREPAADALNPVARAYTRITRESRGRELGAAIRDFHAEIEAMPGVCDLLAGDQDVVAQRWADRFAELVGEALQ